MRYMMLYKTAESDAPPSQEEMAAVGQLIQEMAQAGVLLATDGRSRAHRECAYASRTGNSR